MSFPPATAKSLSIASDLAIAAATVGFIHPVGSEVAFGDLIDAIDRAEALYLATLKI